MILVGMIESIYCIISQVHLRHLTNFLVLCIFLTTSPLQASSPYRPRALGAYVHLGISNLVEISIFNVGRDGHAEALD